MKIFIATDHRGIEREEEIVNYLKSKNLNVIQSQIPHNSTDDYVDYAKEVSQNVANNEDSFGILICGTGIGMSIAANKVKNIRAARCVTKEDAYLTRTDNDANILCISSKTDLITTYEIIDTFINTKFSNEERHIRRVNKIKNIENGD